MKQKVYQYDLLEERLNGRDKALELQAREYERRLDALNGEAGKLHAMQEQYVSKEVFDRAIGSLSDKVQIQTDWKTSEQGRAQWKQWIPYAIAIAAIIFAYIKK